MLRLAIAVLLGGLAVAPRALAQTAPTESEDARYKLERVQEGFIRLDGRTGQVALCSARAAGWACEGIADNPAALASKISRLEGENAALKKQLSAHGIEPPAGSGPEAPRGQSGDHDLKLPSDAELDRMMAFMEKAWRQLVEMMMRVQRDVMKKS